MRYNIDVINEIRRYKMKLYELFGDLILELPIVEQASERIAVKGKVQDLGKQVIKHLIKIYSWNNPRDYPAHVKDINVWLDSIYDFRLKGNKIPKADNYYDWIMTGVDDSSYVTRQIVNIDYHVPRSDKSDEEVFEIIKKIIRNISNDMANKKFTHAKDYMI
jgi:hypothetical protein